MKFDRTSAQRVKASTGALPSEAAQQVLQNGIKVRQLLTPEQLQIVNNTFLNRGIVVTSKPTNGFSGAGSPHAAVTAATNALHEIVLHKTRGFTRIHAGGTAMDYISSGNHVCQLLGDARNSVRFNEYEKTAARHTNANNIRSRRAVLLAQALRTRLSNVYGNEAMCFAGVENCMVAGNVLIFDNSHYDLTFRALARAMRSHGAKTTYCIGIHPREMLLPTKQSGHIAGYNIFWTHMNHDHLAEKVSDDARLVISFGDGSNSYMHNRGEYVKWTKTTCWTDGRTNLVFETEYFGPFAIIKIDAVPMPGTVVRQISLEKPLVVLPDIKFFLKEAYGWCKFPPSKRWHHIDQTLWTRLEIYAASKTDVAWSFPAFASYVKAQATVLSLEDGEWKSPDENDNSLLVNGDALISVFVWLSVLRMQRSQVVGLAYREISKALGDIDFLEKMLNQWLVKPLGKKVAQALGWFDSQESIINPIIVSVDQITVVGTVMSVASVVAHDLIPDDDEGTEVDESAKVDDLDDLPNRAIDEYVKQIAPLENQEARAQMALRGENDDDLGLYVLVEKATRLAMNAPRFDCKFAISIVEGGPGTGKTQYETDNLLAGDIAIVPTRKSKNELESRLKLASKNNKVYTIHSALEHALTEPTPAAKVYVDEAFLQFPGASLLVAAALEANEVVFIGDSKQLKPKDFANSGARITTHHFIGSSKQKHLKDNYRLPACQVEMLNKRFGYDMVAKSRIEGSMAVHDVNSFDELHGNDDIEGLLDNKSTLVLTLTQKLKQRFINHGYSSSTVHEFQGSSARRVAFVVSNDVEQTFLDDIGYFIVAFSRNTQDLFVCRVHLEGGAEFKDIKIGNTDLEALTDVLVPTADIQMYVPPKIVPLVMTEDIANYNLNFDVPYLEEVFGTFWRKTTIANDVLRSVYRRRVPNSAERVHVRPGLVENDEIEFDVYMFGDFNYLADQVGSNTLAMIDTFVSRNGGDRIILDRSTMEKAAQKLVGLKRLRLFRKSKPDRLTISELSAAFARFVEKMIERKKNVNYTRATAETWDIDRLSAFMKNQLKSKWEPNERGFAELHAICQQEAVSDAMQGKAGQGVVGWSKPLCYVYAAYIGAIEKRWETELLPYVIYATRMNDNELVATINTTLKRFRKAILIKGDDVAIIFEKAGKMACICWDASKFDSTQATAVMVMQAYEMGLYGMPAKLLRHYFYFSANNHLKTMCGVLDMSLHFARHSGGYETLWGNTNYSMALVSMALELDHHTEWRTANVSERGLGFLRKVFGAQLKLHEGEIADFVGFLIKDWRAYPDIFRLSAKLLNRRFVDRCDVPKQTAGSYVSAHPKIGRGRERNHQIQLYHSLTQYQVAVNDRIRSGILTNDCLEGCIRANAHYYLPTVPDATDVVRPMLDILATFGQVRFTPIYFDLIVQRKQRMVIMGVDNATDQAPITHHLFNAEVSSEILEEHHILESMLIEPEKHVYGIDEGWSKALRSGRERALTIALSWFQRFKRALFNRLSKIGFLTRYAWIQRLLQRLKPTELKPHNEEEGDDADVYEGVSIISTDVDDAEEADFEDDNDDEDDLDERLNYKKLAERYAAQCLEMAELTERDPDCTKTFSHWIPRKRFVSNDAYKMLDLLPEEVAERCDDPNEFLKIIDIGSAPGGSVEAFTRMPGVESVMAITLPDSIRMRVEHAKIDLRLVDVFTINGLPIADFIFCDVQGLDLQKWQHIKHLVGLQPAAIKLQHFDEQMLADMRGEIFVKPQRSNRYSSEVYVCLNYAHPQAVDFKTYLDEWAKRIAELRRREIPAPLIDQDNLCCNSKSNILDEAFKSITNRTATIKSELELHERLRRVGTAHIIRRGEELVYEFEDKRKTGYWDIDLAASTCDFVDEHRPKAGAAGEPAPEQVASCYGDDATAGADENDLLDMFGVGDVLNARGNSYSGLPYDLVAAVVEEVAAEVARRYGAYMHPAAFAHMIRAMLMRSLPEWGVAGLLQSHFNATLLRRLVQHFVHNTAINAGTDTALNFNFGFQATNMIKSHVLNFSIMLLARRFPALTERVAIGLGLFRMTQVAWKFARTLLAPDRFRQLRIQGVCLAISASTMLTPIFLAGAAERITECFREFTLFWYQPRVNTTWINEKVEWLRSSILTYVGNVMNVEPICGKGLKQIRRIEQPFRVHDLLVENATKALKGPIERIEGNTGDVKNLLEPIINTSDVALGGRGLKVQNGPADPFFTAPVGKEASGADFTTSRCLFIDPYKGEHSMTDEIWYSMLADAYDAGITDGYSSTTVFIRDCCVDVTATNFSYDSATGADVMDSYSALGAGSKTVLHYIYFAGQRATKPPATFKVGRSFNSGASGQERLSFNVRFSAFSK